MSSTTPGRPSIPLIMHKKSSSPNTSATLHLETKRSTSIEAIADTAIPKIKKESSSGFNYQNLAEST
ncbi:unnamed protein product, partial [Rotaria magnacalcarata]